ncbi:demethylmenaquinone methyltransferase [Ferroacidibacillus organovorans]|uniref:Demethylmenaquinone methyltransferase n=1 Tax=Ferroacidibacillus organovorans TaxID=1765683 RepID=A0A162T5V3_9BACL|nr:demethylmenaquinone methyltransferase [Ferroacidibacillus organovorans]KYP80494.1 bifunctional demethylmenaquinone methyltransferase/2-methoxy-6-polyprenyl-1,4-benzoquinol methylase [Ferroacidibacillus organovorans]OAG94722.1 bifunctional demethylmenaquinone methyltransferase/2-methoxy-6-polyprenyl-1,4-benzoquinol methylase [Ferroacidibacillus organovorans]OPG16565.1 bifunctional demethylmenaquinone methyltransferase/2-methoxy-6-polyprenyl-1,4-benzoquinol methylase [Ferroacidibacillus organov
MADTSKAEFVHDVFSTIAKQYDVMNSVLSFNQHKFWRKFAMKKMRIKPGERCLDVATGTGDWAISMANAVGPSGEVVGIDFCQEMLDIAIPKTQQSGLSNVTKMMLGNAMALPFSSDEFNYATIGFALRNVPDLDQVLREMYRVVKPGGLVVSLELSKPTNRLFRSVYYTYFNHVLPLLGRIVVGNDQPYRWLPESLKPFPDRFALAKRFAEAGLERVEHYALMGGICALHIGYKPERSA